jgi:shikimate kinase
MEKIILIGYMGAGKTSLGKSLAQSLNIRFINSDSEIEQQTGMTIGQIFEQYGEDHFRNLEKEFLRTFDVHDSFVLATGGGTPCYKDQMAVLNALGTTIYLQCSNETLFSRLKNERDHRPLIAGLSDDELHEAISYRMQQREPIYKQAKLTLTETEFSVEELIRRLHRKNSD